MYFLPLSTPPPTSCTVNIRIVPTDTGLWRAFIESIYNFLWLRDIIFFSVGKDSWHFRTGIEAQYIFSHSAKKKNRRYLCGREHLWIVRVAATFCLSVPILELRKLMSNCKGVYIRQKLTYH